MKQANCLDLLGRDPQAKYLEAAAHHPERAEPLYECVSAPCTAQMQHNVHASHTGGSSLWRHMCGTDACMLYLANRCRLALWHARQLNNCSGNSICEAQHHISTYLYAKEVRSWQMSMR